MLFWHLGGTIALVRYTFRDERMDLRLLVLGAILPDLLDSPIGLLAYETTSSVRLIGHSLLFAAAVLVLVLFTTRRGRPRKRWMPLAVGVLVHLVLDGMWADPETLWWPLFGFGFTASEATTAGGYVGAVLSDWRVWMLEAIGTSYLVVLGLRSKMGTREARDVLRTTGRVAAPIGRE